MKGRAGSPGFDGARLRQAREARGLTVIALSAMLGVTRQMVALYESGERTPSPELLDKIAPQLAMPREFFFAPSRPVDGAPVFYRSLLAATKTARRKAEQRAVWVQEMTDRLEQLVDFPIVDLPAISLPSHPGAITTDAIEAAALAVREHWGLPDGPVHGLLATAELRGVIVSKFMMESDALDAFSQWPTSSNRPFVFLNSEKDSAARLRLDTAHEIGHQVLHRHIDPLLLRRPENLKLVEQQAFRFGSALLLPAESFLGDVDIYSLDYLRVLKPTWGASIGAMLKRLQDLEVLDEAETRRLWRSYAMRGYKRSEPLDDELKPEQPQLLANAVRAVGGPAAVANALRSTVVLPEAVTEELLGLLPGSMTPSAAPLQARDEPLPEGRDGSVLAFARKRR